MKDVIFSKQIWRSEHQGPIMALQQIIQELQMERQIGMRTLGSGKYRGEFTTVHWTLMGIEEQVAGVWRVICLE